jgi:hypothetical protein
LKDDLFFSNLTFRELLNKIAKTKKGGWILRKKKHWGKEIVDIQI